MSTESAALIGATNKDLALARTAIRRRWPVTREMRDTVLATAHRIANDKNASPRDVVAAQKIILEADKINVAVTKLDQPTAASTINLGIGIRIVSGDGVLPL